MKDRTHSFSVEEAQKYGIEKALLLNNLRFWLDRHQANGTHIYEHTDGKEYHWVYNSKTAFQKLFPYLKSSSITRWLAELQEAGVIISGNFNQNKYDRTNWYSMPSFLVSTTQNESWTNQNESSTTQNESPIPVSYTVSDTEKKEYKEKKDTSFFRNPKESARYEELRKHTGSSYEPDGNSPLVIREEIKKLEKQMKLRETPEKVKFMFTAGWQFFNWYKSVVGLEYHGGILSLDPVAKLLSEWYDRGMNEMGVTRLVSRYFKSRKAKEGVITPTSCFSEHTFQAFVQKKLK